jgi:SAM-dependent methyltransferase
VESTHHAASSQAARLTPPNTGIGETGKARARRLASGWFEKYIDFAAPGLDIGCGNDPLTVNLFRGWDLPDGDATLLAGLADASFQTVYASHVLEHIRYVDLGLRHWWRVLRPGGRLIVIVPHRDLYEKRLRLPSIWNPDHKHFWLPETTDPPDTLNFRDTLRSALPDAVWEEFVVRNDGWASNGPDEHSSGEYSIEAVLRK